MVAVPEIRRHRTHAVRVGKVTIGGGAPVVVQSMTNTDTADVDGDRPPGASSSRRAGSEIVRITVNNEAAAAAVPVIRERLDVMGCDVPLVGDFHYNGHRLLRRSRTSAAALAKLRINPGNVGFGDKRDRQFEMMVEAAIRCDRPVRIGVNWGSLDQDLPRGSWTRTRPGRTRSRPTSCCARRWCARPSRVLPNGRADRPAAPT